MLKKILVILSVTALVSTLAVGDFFLMRALPILYAFVIHNILASLIGICFVVAGQSVRRRLKGWEYHSFFLLLVGIAMLSIHIVKIFFSRC